MNRVYSWTFRQQFRVVLQNEYLGHFSSKKLSRILNIWTWDSKNVCQYEYARECPRQLLRRRDKNNIYEDCCYEYSHVFQVIRNNERFYHTFHTDNQGYLRRFFAYDPLNVSISSKWLRSFIKDARFWTKQRDKFSPSLTNFQASIFWFPSKTSLSKPNSNDHMSLGICTFNFFWKILLKNIIV